MHGANGRRVRRRRFGAFCFVGLFSQRSGPQCGPVAGIQLLCNGPTACDAQAMAMLWAGGAPSLTCHLQGSTSASPGC